MLKFKSISFFLKKYFTSRKIENIVFWPFTIFTFYCYPLIYVWWACTTNCCRNCNQNTGYRSTHRYITIIPTTAVFRIAPRDFVWIIRISAKWVSFWFEPFVFLKVFVISQFKNIFNRPYIFHHSKARKGFHLLLLKLNLCMLLLGLIEEKFNYKIYSGWDQRATVRPIRIIFEPNWCQNWAEMMLMGNTFGLKLVCWS